MKAWDELLSSLEKQLGPKAVQEWLRPMRVSRFDAANLYLEATPFQQAWFEEHVRSGIEDHFLNNNQRPIRIHWESQKNLKKAPVQPPGFKISPHPLEKEFRLDTFLPLPANEMALQMAQELSLGEKPAFNPVFYSGPKGSGKTHLLMSIAHALQAKGKKVFYVKAETFTGHVVQAIRLGFMQEFRKAYREIDTLILEDIHLLARRSSTQEEFFHTFNSLHTLGRQIILSAEDVPNQLQDIEPRLISRFEWGISLRLDRIDPPLLRLILQQKAQQLDLQTTPELLSFLLTRFGSHPKASIEALHALALRSPRNLSIQQAERVLADLLEKESASILTPEKVIKTTAAHFGIRVEDLTGKSQMREFVQPRQIAMYFCRKILQLPFQTIGRIFTRDHSTVMASIRLVDAAAETKQPPFSDPVNAILRKFGRLEN